MTSLGTLSFDTRLNAQAVKDADQIKKQVLHKLGNSIPLKLKVTFTSKDLRADLQNQLNKFKPKVKVDIVVDQAAASQAVQQALAKAGLMNSMTSGQLRAQRAAEIQQRMQIALAKAQMQASMAADRHSKSLLTLNSHFGNGITLGGKLSATVASIYSVYTLKNFVQSMIEIGGEFQKQRIALETMLGSLSKADVMYRRMKELAVESPFTFMDLMSYTKQLKAFQIPYNELFDTTKRLGDISAGLGVDMNRLILAFGQVRSAAFLRGQEVRQFTEAGIPLVDALAKKFSELEKKAVSAGEVFDKISKRQVSFGMVKDVLWEMTDEGGQFFNMQSKLTESLSGKLDKLKDSYQIMIAEMAQGNNAILGGMLDAFTKLVQYGDKVIGMLGTLTAAFLTYKGAVIALNAVHAVQGFIGAMKLATGVQNLGRAMQGLTTLTWRQVAAQQALNMVSKANWIAIAVAAATSLIGMYLTFRDETESLTKSVRELRAEIQEEFEAMDEVELKGQELIRTMFNESKTVDQQKAAYERLQALYPDMFKNMDFEQAKRKTNIDLLKMETKAARDAMQAKLNERIADAKARQAEAKSKYDEYNKQDNERSRKIRESYGGKKALDDFDESLKKYRDQYISISNELDELSKLQEEVTKRSVTASKNRTSKWWNEAKKIAGDLTMYAPKEDQDFEDYFDAVQKNLNSRKALLDKMTEQSETYAQVKEEVETLKSIYEKALGGKTEALSKFKGGSKKDYDLEAAKTKLAEYRAFLSEYKKYIEVYSKEDSIRMLEDLFPNLKGKGRGLVENYVEMLDKLRDSLAMTSEERKKWANEVNKTKTDTIIDREREKMKLYASEADITLQRLIKKWDAYKKLVDQTGNREFAIAMSGFTDTNKADALRRLIENMPKGWSIDFGDVFNMGGEQIEKYVHGLGLVSGEAEAVIKYLKEWRNAQMELRNEALETYGKMIADAGGLSTEIDIINNKYDEQIRKLKELKELEYGNPSKLSDREYEEKVRQSERSRKLDLAELFVNSIDFGQLFETLGNTAIATANTVKSEIDKLISEKEVKRLSQAELERYLNLRDKLNTVGGKNSVNPFSKSAWSDLSAKSTAFNDTLKETIANMKKYLKALEDEEKATNDLAATQDTAGKQQAQANLDDARLRKKEASARLAQNKKNLKIQGKELSDAQTRIIKGAESMVTSIQQIFAGNLHDLTLGVLNIINAIKGGGEDGAGGAAQSIGEALSAMGVNNGNVYGAIIGAILTILDTIKDDAVGFFRDLLDDVFDAVSGILDDLFSGELIGTIIGEVVSGISKIFQSIGGLIKNIFDGSFFTGIWDGFASAFNDDDEKQALIEESKKQVDLLQNLCGLLDKALERNLGGIFTTRVGQKDLEKLIDYRNRYTELQKLEGKGGFWEAFAHSMDYIDKDTRKAIDDAISSQSYYDTKIAELNLQKSELQHQLELEERKKDSDSEQIEDYKQQIAEMEDQIEHFAEDLAKTLYDIDIKSWASDLGDALFEAWQKGEDGADAFRKKAKEIITDVAKNIAVMKLVETALAPVLDIITDEMKKKDGRLDSESIAAISEAMALVGTTLPTSFNALMDGLDEGLQKAGLGSMKDDEEKSSSSVGGDIKSITENTADLLASYVNAIRADVSMIRIQEAVSLPAITEAVQRTNVLAETQVSLQQQIAQNTLRNADAADRIYDLLHKVAPDGTKIRVA